MSTPRPEFARLKEAHDHGTPWRKWGPYLSERQWGTVREDYSADGNAWSYFSHDQARSRAYKWGEDGLGGISDDQQILCFALALWNGQDPILKERLFGLTNAEGNHGEDVKEYYFYIDSTPTHSYMKYLYKYPQRAFPYDDLVAKNKGRSREEMEYELLDTGIFDDDRYFDVFVEYAKAGPEDILIKISVHNRGPQAAELRVLPTLWFRNTWAWGGDEPKPTLSAASAGSGIAVVKAAHATLGDRYLYAEAAGDLLFTENETNAARLFGAANAAPYVKDSINDYVVNGVKAAVNPERAGTKAAADYTLSIPAGGSATLRLRLTDAGALGNAAFADFDATFAARLQEADVFYESITPDSLDADHASVMRQALAGMLWSKQFYFYNVDRWLEEHNAHPLNGATSAVRNREWFHMLNRDVISMPDKWEYPWYAAWDLAFHTVALNIVDYDFAQGQLRLMLDDMYLHPNGQLPAYEWNFGDVNPPVHAWATLFSYTAQKMIYGQVDLEFLKQSFAKLLANFTWWVNRKDPTGRNVFEGGFLGLDNIGIFDRSAPLPSGGRLEQADGTAWMAFFSQNMLEISLELALRDPDYESMALKFVQHFLWIAAAMDRVGDNKDEMWDEHDGFFYDVLRLPDGSAERLKVRSMVGLLPLCATTVISEEVITRFPEVTERVHRFLEQRPELVANIAPINKPGVNGRRLLSIMNEDKLRRVLAKMLDESEFLGPHGIRSLSRYHLDHPYRLEVNGQAYEVTYLPAESNTGMFGGNSNWRGPVWMPVNALIIRALMQSYLYYGDDFKVECPTGSGQMMTLYEVAEEITRRLSGTFTRDESGRRPVYGGAKKFQDDPHWRDYILFYEYFHGDNGAGLGASHQTGWTGLVARFIQMLGYLNAEAVLSDRATRPLASVYQEDD